MSSVEPPLGAGSSPGTSTGSSQGSTSQHGEEGSSHKSGGGESGKPNKEEPTSGEAGEEPSKEEAAKEEAAKESEVSEDSAEEEASNEEGGKQEALGEESSSGTESSGTGSEGSDALSDPIDPKFLTGVPFGTSSFWIQPWRAYLDTWPASRLVESLGINFDVHPAQAQSTAQLLQDSGFTLARIEVNWDSLSYSNPSTFVNEASIRSRLEALHSHGLRPLILLDANSVGPAPAKRLTLTTTSEAPAGAQTVMLSAASAAQVVPGKTGFDELSFTGDPDILITEVGPEGQATLSKPLPSPLAPGAHNGATLLYAPFSSPKLPDGEANPAFQETMNGWLGYVATVSRLAASIFGPGGFDLEVWNELTFGSQFLDAENYYSPVSETSKKEVTHEVTKALLDETVAWVRNPANGLSAGVGISNGFASQTPFPSGANAPIGLTALSKHLYAGAKTFPAGYTERRVRPINALGKRDTSSSESFTPNFIPSYQSLYPEFSLSDIQTATIVRDLAPFSTTVYGWAHGRGVGPEGGSPIQKWMTEYNISAGKATPVGPDEVTPQSSVTLSSADKMHLQSKGLLRSLVAMVSKGMTREYFFHAAPGHLSLIGEEFFQALAAHPSLYPGDQLGGETVSAFRNMLSQFQGPGPGAPNARQLKLLSVGQTGEHTQFKGDGTAAHPSLYDREVLAVFPFQSSPTKFVIPVYVMTRDLLTLYEPSAPASDTKRYDLPDESFRITLSNLPETASPPTVSAYDPLQNTHTPAQLISRARSTATFEIAASDYPRILTIDYTGK